MLIENLYKDIFENSIDGIFFLSKPDLIFLDANSAFRQFIKYTKDELLLKTLFNITNSKNLIQDAFAMVDTTNAFLFDLQFISSKDEIIDAELSVSQIHKEDQSIYLVLSRNIATKKVLEEKLDFVFKEVEKYSIKVLDAINEINKAKKAKSIFFANVSHELRTPLNAIIGFSQLLLQDIRIIENQRSYVKTIYNSAMSLLSIINDVLALSKLESGEMIVEEKDFLFQMIIDEIKGLFIYNCKKKGIEFSITVESSIPTILRGDYKKLKSVLLNLIDNAIKFTNSGYVKLSVVSTTPSINIHDNQKIWLKFSVKDTGIGISDIDQELIFEPFHQIGTTYEGTGIGLAITSKMIRLLGGKLNLESTKDIGSEFYFEIPIIISDQNVIIEEKENKSSKQPEDFKILLVDDIDSNRILLETFLHNQGFHTVQAKNGKQAIEMYQKEKPDLIFMDIIMPVMNGIEATTQIRLDTHSNIPIIATTASVFEDEDKKLFESGFTDILIKPFQETEIFEKILKYLNINIDVYTESPDENQLEETIKSVCNFICQSKYKDEFKENIEYQEFDNILKIIEKIKNPSANEIKSIAHIKKAITDLNYSFFIKLFKIVD